MNKTEVLNTIKLVREKSKKRKFDQTFDFIINLKDFDIKKDSINTYLVFPFSKGKKVKVCALVGKDLLTQAKEVCDKVIFEEEFDKWAKDKKALKKLISEYDYFIAQADLMRKIATTFGKILGPKGKMPDPKAGCVVPPKLSDADFKKLYDNLQKTIKVATKSEAIIKCPVGNESMDDEKICENVLHLYSSMVHLLPLETNNISSLLIKLTMSPVIKIGEKKEDLEKRLQPKIKEKPGKSYKERKGQKKAGKKVNELKDKKIEENKELKK